MQKEDVKLTQLELTRLRNVADNKAMLARLMADLEKLGDFPQKPNPKKVVIKQEKGSDDFVIRRKTSRSSRFNPIGERPMTRSRTRRGSVSSQSSSAGSSPNKEGHLIIKFGSFSKPRLMGSDSESDEEWEKVPKKRRVSSIRCLPHVIKTPEEITQNDLNMVAIHVSEKTYDHIHGTTCHQCRQKTFDQKTICRSETCQGVRGLFCGPCLRNRYGEDVKVALKDPDWQCPPCRGICNCSICRRRLGKCSTGILIHLAKDNGFDDVNAYLQSLRAKKQE